MNQNITYDGCHDPQFARPYVDVDEWRESPVRHHYIHGGFEGTQTRFCFYYPPEDVYKKRFFQFVSPFVGDEKEAQFQDGEEDKISFAIEHGAYFVESNLGGIVNGGNDHTLVYRASACCAQFSRQLAEKFYGSHRPYGYVYGGSGGGYKTISCVENTVGVWDGAVPFVIGSPMSLPTMYTVRAHAMRVLRHKLAEIKDALEPGGSGNPYECLNEEEADALKEAWLLGFPMKTWCVYETLGEGALPLLASAVMGIDPTYCNDFWTLPGYLGTAENSSAVKDRIVMESYIKDIYECGTYVTGMADSIDKKNAYGVDEAWKHAMGKGQDLPIFILDQAPEGEFYKVGMNIRFIQGELCGESFGVTWLGPHSITINPGVDTRDLKVLLSKVVIGDKVILDNSDYIAMQTFHRHQVPGLEYHAWDQFRDSSGQPIYPQRSVQTGPLITAAGAGSVQNGKPNCKVIVLESLMDESAFPWQADWYRKEIQKNAGGDAEDQMRLWFMENCMHTDCQEDNGGDHQHIVSYLGALCQALLDISDWAERGIAPPSSSNYDMDGGQVEIKATAAERKGIQPVVSMCVDGGTKKQVCVGDTVIFDVTVDLPEGSGDVESVLWDFETSNVFVPGGVISENIQNGKIKITHSHTFEKAGVYFPVVKVSTNRRPGDRFTSIRNQGRVRVIVQ